MRGRWGGNHWPQPISSGPDFQPQYTSMDPTAQFMQQTGISDANQAASLLAAADGDVDLAVAIYQSAVTAQPAAAARPAPVSKPKAKPTGGIVSFSSLTALDTGDDSDEDDRQSYYAGGAKGSGVQIQDPRKKDKDGGVAKVVAGVFDRARQGGARTDEEEAAEQEKPFQGSGYRLGNTNSEGPAKASVKPQAERLKKVVAFYRQGFTVDDGPLRSYSDKANHAFLQDIQQGYIPRELEQEAAGRELQTELLDRKNEDYKEPERPKFNAFAGSGHSLSAASSSSAAAAPVAVSTPFVLDPAAPTVSIQIRFHDGTKAAAKVNATHTIMDLRAWIEQNKPTPGAYDLLGGFPPKPLSDLNQTVQAAGLSGAVVQQKLR